MIRKVIMATNYFCKIKDYPGESSDKAHKEWIEVIEFDHALEQEAGATRAATGGLTTGRTTHRALRIVKFLDKSTPKLAQACSGGKHIGEVLVEFNKMIGDKQCPYMEYKLSDAVVTAVRPKAAYDERRSDSAPTEEILLGYNKIEWTYTEYDSKGGKKGQTKGSWNLAENTP